MPQCARLNRMQDETNAPMSVAFLPDDESVMHCTPQEIFRVHYLHLLITDVALWFKV